MMDLASCKMRQKLMLKRVWALVDFLVEFKRTSGTASADPWNEEAHQTP